ncbi:hypothetical protein ACIQLJ_14890 [Microbacterium sp. NPDC091313]
MSAVLVAPPATAAGLRWTEVEHGFHVAHRGDAFAGYVDTTSDGSFVAFDEFSTPIGRYATLGEAQRSLRTTASPANERTRARLTHIRRHAAVIAGGVAGAMLLTAGVLSPFL